MESPILETSIRIGSFSPPQPVNKTRPSSPLTMRNKILGGGRDWLLPVSTHPPPLNCPHPTAPHDHLNTPNRPDNSLSDNPAWRERKSLRRKSQ
ncbi:hypothetical protein BLNAU_13575 [Blattamonas nauphoetae]|uniref:Uncharacterized protein n=1 Tax=Blattamonas nauphoetae TaxID=2049346 RepID=A0ABQ9XG26_9EUKA|nr:hypothetical protein BLNAU_13575 [Blattamonas nauphoetae]